MHFSTLDQHDFGKKSKFDNLSYTFSKVQADFLVFDNKHPHFAKVQHRKKNSKPLVSNSLSVMQHVANLGNAK